MLLAVMYQINRVFFIYPPALNQLELNNIIITKQLNENCSSHTQNEEDDAFDRQLEKLGVEKIFLEHSETVKRDLKAYIEDW